MRENIIPVALDDLLAALQSEELRNTPVERGNHKDTADNLQEAFRLLNNCSTVARNLQKETRHPLVSVLDTVLQALESELASLESGLISDLQQAVSKGVQHER